MEQAVTLRRHCQNKLQDIHHLAADIPRHPVNLTFAKLEHNDEEIKYAVIDFWMPLSWLMLNLSIAVPAVASQGAWLTPCTCRSHSRWGATNTRAAAVGPQLLRVRSLLAHTWWYTTLAVSNLQC
jgi:hypothetical protein